MRIATILTTFAFLAVQANSYDIRSKRKIATGTLNPYPHHPQFPISNSTDDDAGISPKVRAYWMHQTFHALNASGSPCPLYPFAAVIVNRTSPNNNADKPRSDLDLGELICTGVNYGRQTGNMMLHGEISAILNCTSILQDPAGKYRLSPAETIEAFKGLSLYTNAESCPMVLNSPPSLSQDMTEANDREFSARPPSGGMASRSISTGRRSPDWLSTASRRLRSRPRRFLRRRRGCHLKRRWLGVCLPRRRTGFLPGSFKMGSVRWVVRGRTMGEGGASRVRRGVVSSYL
jgi:hypothetical protein